MTHEDGQLFRETIFVSDKTIEISQVPLAGLPHLPDIGGDGEHAPARRSASEDDPAGEKARREASAPRPWWSITIG